MRFGANFPGNLYNNKALTGYQGNRDFKLPNNKYDQRTAALTMALHVADQEHYATGDRHEVALKWRKTGTYVNYGNQHDTHWKGLHGSSSPTGQYPTKAYFEKFLPNPDGDADDLNYNHYQKRFLTYDDIISAVTTIYADFVLGSTGGNAPDNFGGGSDYVSADLHRHLLGGLRPGSQEPLAENYSFPGISKALKNVFDHEDTSLWKGHDLAVNVSRGPDHYAMPKRWQKDARKWILKQMDSGKRWVDEANGKMYTDAFETARFDQILQNLISYQKEDIANRRALFSKIENDMVKVGRLEYLYLYLDFD